MFHLAPVFISLGVVSDHIMRHFWKKWNSNVFHSVSLESVEISVP